LAYCLDVRRAQVELCARRETNRCETRSLGNSVGRRIKASLVGSGWSLKMDVDRNGMRRTRSGRNRPHHSSIRVLQRRDLSNQQCNTIPNRDIENDSNQVYTCENTQTLKEAVSIPTLFFSFSSSSSTASASVTSIVEFDPLYSELLPSLNQRKQTMRPARPSMAKQVQFPMR